MRSQDRSEPKIEQSDDNHQQSSARALSEAAMNIAMEQRQLSTRDKVALGNWLHDNFSNIEKAQFKDAPKTDGSTPYSPDGRISVGDLRRVYSDGQWKDGTPISHRDKLFCKQAIAHYDQAMKGGTYGYNIDKYDVDRLRHGAAAHERDGRTVARYQDGTRVVSTDGKVEITRKDGTKEYANNEGSLVLHPNGTGSLTMEHLGGSDERNNVTIPLRRQKDGSWSAKDTEGNTVNIAFDKNHAVAKLNGETIFEQTKETALLVGEHGDEISASKKGLISRGSEDEQFSFVQNSDESVQALRLPNGDKETYYNDDAGVIQHSDGSKLVFWGDSSDKGKLIEIDKDHKMVMKDDDGKPLPTMVMEDGTQIAQGPDYKATFKPDGELTVEYACEEETTDPITHKTTQNTNHMEFTITADGRYKGGIKGGTMKSLDPLEPPPLK